MIWLLGLLMNLMSGGATNPSGFPPPSPPTNTLDHHTPGPKFPPAEPLDDGTPWPRPTK